MSDSGFEFTIGDWDGATGSGFYFTFGDASTLDPGSTGRAGCTAGACPHPTEHPAEADWVHLASAVPVAGQLARLTPRCGGMAYPTEDDFRSALAAVRPDSADEHSLERLRGAWAGEVAEAVAEWPGLIKSRLAALSSGWVGEDFDAFAAQVDQARSLVDGIVDDVEAACEELRDREEAAYILQGGDSGEIPYPAPMVGCEGEWTELVAIHVRPAWWSGDCITMTCEEAERALELAGADAGLAAEVREFIEDRVGEGMAALGSLAADVRALAGEEARERFGSDVEAELAAYVERQAAVDEDIAQRRADQGDEFGRLRVTCDERPYPSTADPSRMDLAEPEAELPAAPSSPAATQDPVPTPPGGGGGAGRSEEDEPDPDPWEAVASEESDEGGLAGGGSWGGGFGGAAGTAGAPGGGAAVPGTGSGPGGGAVPAVPAAAGGGGAGTARPTAVTTAAHGPAGGARPAGGGGGKANDRGEEDDAPPTRRELDNVWGYVPLKNDPYQ